MNYLTIQELVEELKVSRQTIFEWRKKGMPYIKIGRSVRFVKSDVEKWIQQGEVNVCIPPETQL